MAKANPKAPQSNLPWWHIFLFEAGRGGEFHSWDSFQGQTLNDALYGWLTTGDRGTNVEVEEIYAKLPVGERPPKVLIYSKLVNDGEIWSYPDGCTVWEREESTIVIGPSREKVALRYCQALIARTDDKLEEIGTKMAAAFPNIGAQVNELA